MLIQIITLVAGLLAEPILAFPTTPSTQSAKIYDNEGDLPVRLPRSNDLPINRTLVRRSNIRRRGTLSGETGLGDNADLLYTVPIELGNTVTAVNLDTGSSDLWAVSDACREGTCRDSRVTRYPTTGGKSTGIDVVMSYGDSSTGSSATGTIGLDTAAIAGVTMRDQAFSVVNDTDNPVVQYDAAGIFGLGFPAGSKVQESLLTAQSGPINTTDDFLLATYTYGPLISRIMMTGALESPMFTITLSRDTIDISGHGQLTLGKLPDGVDNSSLTWVPVRLYSSDEGGLRSPTFAPNEVYPLRWEVDIDGVIIDGQHLGASTIPAHTGVDSNRTSALIDTGNSIIRGPEDVVNKILGIVSPSYEPNNQDSEPIFPCINPHTLVFQIGGKAMFPIDPRDFIGQFKSNDAKTCVADNIVPTDPPRFGSLFRWSLGDPFFRSNLVAFHYGNITHPSTDPPRIGILSLVPSNADELYVTAVNDALNNGGNFEKTIDPAPTASATNSPQTTVSIGNNMSLTDISTTSMPSLAGTSLATPTNGAHSGSSTFSNAWTWKEGVSPRLIVSLLVIRLIRSL
ncbi:hypothetical protein Ac2012v2_005940 [Leucoagaricus gongylophorus]